MYLAAINLLVKFIYSEKATNFCKISSVDLFYVVTVKSTVEILQNSVAFSEYMNFKYKRHKHKLKSIFDQWKMWNLNVKP